MKNKHLFLVWEGVSTTTRNICKKLRRFLILFNSCKQISHDFAARHHKDKYIP